MPREYKSKTQKPYKKHDPTELKKAVEEVKNNVLTLRKAAEKYGINYSVIYRHLKKGDTMKAQGVQTSLSKSEELILVDRLKTCAEWGYPVDTLTLRMIVKEFLDRKGKQVLRFKNNLPGKEFIYSFLKRHRQDLSYRMCQNIKRNRAAVSHEIINDYFNRLQEELQGLPPQNIVNFDETNLCDDPGKKKVITRRGCKYPERLMNSTKASTSVMFSAAGDGTILPPYEVYKALHMYNSWSENGPRYTRYNRTKSGWSENGPRYTRYNRTKSGWFDSFCFEDWIMTVAIPYLKKQTGKKILIGDNLASHLTLEVIRMCSENDIHLIFLPANSTHITQPLDVAFFRPLKIKWRKILEQWKSGPSRNETNLPKDRFPRLLNQLMESITEQGPSNVRAGFKKCGIVPLDREAVLQMLPTSLDTFREKNDSTAIDTSFVELLKNMIYEGAGASTRKKRTKINVLPGKSVVARESDSSESSYEMSLHDSDSDPPSESNASDDDSSEEETAARSQIRPVAIHQSGVSGIAAKPISEVITSSYPFLVKKEDIQEGDWLLVNFTLYTSNAGSSSSNKKPYIGKVRALTENGNFEGEFYRHRSSREFPGLIYGLPDVPDISEFDYNQVVGKLNPPKEYRRGLKKFDIDI